MTTKQIKHFGIIAATFSGNRGAEAMLLSTIDFLRQKDPECHIHVMSYAPVADIHELQLRPIKNVFIHSSKPIVLVTQWFVFSIAAKMFGFLKGSLAPKHMQGILSLLRLDAVFCLAGVSFIDGREKFLPFNVLTLFPFLINKVPVFKMAQALGPITSFPNRLCSKWTLPKIRYLFARGNLTKNFILESNVLNSNNWEVSPDITFGMKCEAPQSIMADIVIIPSVILDKRHANYKSFLVELVTILSSKGYSVNLMAHSWKSETENPFNNDLPLCRELKRLISNSNISINILGEGQNAREIKNLVAAHKLCLTSRFHGMIASLDMCVPTLVIGWSHKYREILQMFDREKWALSYKEITPESCAKNIELIITNEAAEKKHMQLKIPELRMSVVQAFEKIWLILNSPSKFHQ